MSKLLTLFLLLSLFSFATACKKSAPPPSSPSPSSAASPTPVEYHAGGGTTPTVPAKYFKGSIGDSLDLQMKLMRNGDQLTGSYTYTKVGTKIDLKGQVDNDGNLTLEEFDPSGKQTGVFQGVWKTDGPDGPITIAGNWSKPAGDKAADKKTAFSIHEEPINLSGEVDVVTKRIKESNKPLMYEIDAQYPQLTGGSNPNFEKFNQLVRASVTKKVAMFKKEMAPKEEEEPRPEGSMGSDLNVSYTVALLQEDLASIEFSVGSYYMGAAHPNSYSEVVNYDLKNGKLLKLSDLFTPDAKFLPALSTYCIKDLKNQSKSKEGMLEDESWIEKGAAPSAKNYQSWTITKKGLGINFDSYQVGPYAAGPQFVLVPYSAIKDLVNTTSAVGQFSGK
ncbi:MAG TPA: DUF3298 domain-containing protein [Pyrinomonadaceae bacterium]|nr:DUF3298 domain-containing protein [Pyrinomonadaceae bacterium]